MKCMITFVASEKHLAHPVPSKQTEMFSYWNNNFTNFSYGLTTYGKALKVVAAPNF